MLNISSKYTDFGFNSQNSPKNTDFGFNSRKRHCNCPVVERSKVNIESLNQ